MENSNKNILEYLQYKNNQRLYSRPEVLTDNLSKLPVTLIGDAGQELMMYLLVRKVGSKKAETYETVSTAPYKAIELIEEEGKIVCEKFDSCDSEDVTVYDMNGLRVNEDSGLTFNDYD